MVRAIVPAALVLALGCSESNESAVSASASSTTGAGATGGSSGAGATGGAGGAGGSGPDCSQGEPIIAPPDAWTVVFSDGTSCGNAGMAGFAINPSERSQHLLLVLGGGGACFNQADCQASLLGGFNEMQALALVQGRPIFDRASASNPFADWDWVFVPYCNGDFHSGDNVASYGVSHVGYTNLVRHLTRIVPTFCDADRVVLAGMSAGGFGATFNYAMVHDAYGSIPVDLIDDSGPYMQPPHMPLAMQDDIDQNWGFRANMPADCSECAAGWHGLYTYAATHWPDDRMSLLSYTRDPSIQGRFAPYTPLDTLDDFETAINALADEVLAPLPNVHVFYLPGTGHVLTSVPFDALSVNGTSLEAFLRMQIDDDPAWADAR